MIEVHFLIASSWWYWLGVGAKRKQNVSNSLHHPLLHARVASYITRRNNIWQCARQGTQSPQKLQESLTKHIKWMQQSTNRKDVENAGSLSLNILQRTW